MALVSLCPTVCQLHDLRADHFARIYTPQGGDRYYKPVVAGIPDLAQSCYIRAGEHYFTHSNEADSWYRLETALLDWLFFVIFLGGCWRPSLPLPLGSLLAAPTLQLSPSVALACSCDLTM